MKTAKKLVAALLLTCLVLGLSGCGAGNLKDNILDGYNQWLQFSSKHALAKENKLHGKKWKGRMCLPVTIPALPVKHKAGTLHSVVKRIMNFLRKSRQLYRMWCNCLFPAG